MDGQLHFGKFENCLTFLPFISVYIENVIYKAERSFSLILLCGHNFANERLLLTFRAQLTKLTAQLPKMA